MAHTLHVISHTHWDREWYLPYQLFRIRLVDLLDHLLDILDTDTDFKHFSLDAQTIVLEDYLQIHPQNRERLCMRINEGRIAVGPWYQLNDEFLVSGESTVRSLLIGSHIAREFGCTQKIGYLPDQFGNISQMPQIFKGFGIDNAIMGRGYQLVGDRKMEFIWEGPDGSRLLSSLMAFWYNNAQYFPSAPTDALEFAQNLRKTMAEKSLSNHLLLMNGVDHLAAQPEIGSVISAVQAMFDTANEGEHITHSTLESYMNGVRADLAGKEDQLARVQGELREDRGGSCLAGTLSARMYLKQANRECQTALEWQAERLCAFAWIGGAQYPRDMLRYAWKLLMENHPHDSICGCSVDETHADMIPRFRQTLQIANELTDRALDSLSERNRTQGAVESARSLTVYNTLNWPRTDPVTAVIEFPLGAPARGNAPRDDSRAPRGFKILAPGGAEIPFAVIHVETVPRQVINPRELPLDQWVRRFKVEFVATLVPSCGYRTYRIEPCDVMPRYPEISEEFPISPYLLSFEDGGEVGDEYLHVAPLRDTLYSLRPDRSHLAQEANAVRHTMIFRQQWELPVSAGDDTQSRSGNTIPCAITTRMTRWAGLERVEFETTFDNRVKDHRLRARFDCGALIQADPYLFTEQPFDVVARPLINPYGAEGGSPFYPQQTFSAMVGKGFGWSDDPEDGANESSVTLINRGLPEIEVVNNSEGDNALLLTLLRSVGSLSNTGDGPLLKTPDAQCPGEHTFHYALYHGLRCWKGGTVWRQAHQFNSPLIAVQGNALEGRQEFRSFVEISHPQVVLSALKQTEDRNSLIVRCYNITEDPLQGVKIRVPSAVQYRCVNLNEEPQDEWREGDTFQSDMGPKRIITVEFEFPTR